MTNQTRTASAHGKIILSGEYAGVFGYRAIAVPSPEHTLTVTYEEHAGASLILKSTAMHPGWERYLRSIITHCEEKSGELFGGTLSVTGSMPVGKGMGSSTALVITLCRCLLEERATLEFCKSIEDIVNVGNSGLDFAVIWANAPVIFKKGEPNKPYDIPSGLLEHMTFIDTGTPDQTTPEMIAWVQERSTSPDVQDALKMIGQCTERSLAGEDLHAVMRDHHRAQVALGVVPEPVQKIIAEIETKGGSAKVIGAGARTGGGGMVLQIP